LDGATEGASETASASRSVAESKERALRATGSAESEVGGGDERKGGRGIRQLGQKAGAGEEVKSIKRGKGGKWRICLPKKIG